MSAIYDNWERLVAATLKKQQLWELFHAPSRTPTTLSESSSFNSTSANQDSWWPEEPPKLVLLSDFSPALSVNDVQMASAELIGTGTFGTAYSATMDNGVKIVVKRLKSRAMSEWDFKRHMDIVGNVKHGNIAPLRAYYVFDNERILLYDYFNDGSVYALLHGRTGEYRAQVRWETRREIAIGTARAITEIHKKNGGRLVHGNIKASNVFLSPQFHCCVSDLGLASMIGTAFMPHARCYAPEVKNSKDVSQESDVYSFGVLLLELLTRKPSVHIPGGPEAVDLVKLIRSKRAAKVLDTDLLQYPATIRNAMVDMLQIGLTCAAKSVKKRPKMSEVVKMLEGIPEVIPVEDIPEITPVSPAPLIKRDLRFCENVIPEFSLEELLNASAEVLGKGTSGTSYKANLENGYRVMVKRLKDVVVTEGSFVEHIEVLGKMKHKNIANTMAYSYSKEEKFLVYHYYDEGSVSSLLHGRRSATDRTVLDWTTRLKIAMDAARGIAHIHRENDGKLVHGNIKSSNIFLLDHKYAVVSDAGCTKLINPVKLSSRRRLDYHAPEVTDTWNVTQASDVYSFGVFLIELASGLPPGEITNDGFSFIERFQSVAPAEWIAKVMDKKLLIAKNDDEPRLVRLLQLGTDCINSDVQRRPTMSQVVRMLEGIGGVESSDIDKPSSIELSLENLSLEDGMEEDTVQTSIESRLENLVLCLLPMLDP